MSISAETLALAKAYTNSVALGEGAVQGPQGEQGLQGEQGVAGLQGPKGDPGPQGPAGEGISLPAGVIVMWSGAVTTIPEGWALCNGSNDTPDLRNRFIVGAGGTYEVGNSGGEDSVILTVSQMPKHEHYVTKVYASGTSTSAQPLNNASQTSGVATTSAGGSTTHENRPPYYALAYIMKL